MLPSSSEKVIPAIVKQIADVRLTDGRFTAKPPEPRAANAGPVQWDMQQQMAQLAIFMLKDLGSLKGDVYKVNAGQKEAGEHLWRSPFWNRHRFSDDLLSLTLSLSTGAGRYLVGRWRGGLGLEAQRSKHAHPGQDGCHFDVGHSDARRRHRRRGREERRTGRCATAGGGRGGHGLAPAAARPAPHPGGGARLRADAAEDALEDRGWPANTGRKRQRRPGR